MYCVFLQCDWRCVLKGSQSTRLICRDDCLRTPLQLDPYVETRARMEMGCPPAVGCAAGDSWLAMEGPGRALFAADRSAP